MNLWFSFLFLKMGHPWPLFRLFSSFQANITIITTINVKKCPSSIWYRGSSSQPLEHESPPLTTSFHFFVAVSIWSFRPFSVYETKELICFRCNKIKKRCNKNWKFSTAKKWQKKLPKETWKTSIKIKYRKLKAKRYFWW